MRTNSLLCLVTGFALGCNQSPAPAKLPEPVKVEVPTTPPEETKSAGEIASIDGNWTHTLPGENGVQRRVVLKYIKDQDGPERFEIVQHDWPDKPVFTERIQNGQDTELRFKMVAPNAESIETPRTLRYLIHPENGQWVGTLTESWTSTTYPVVFTKSE